VSAVASYVAPASERVLGFGSYLAGAVELALVVGALAFGAYAVRALALPGWSGAPARVVELVLGVAGLIWVSEALGTLGGFQEGAVLAAMIVVGIAAGLIARRLAASRPVAAAAIPPAPPSWSLAQVVAVLACAALAAGWMVPTLGTLAAGMDRSDSLWYHMPLAASFVQTGYLGHIYFFDPVFLASFYPANSEVVHALGILFFDRDIVSPLLNLGWLAVALLASYCIGRPYGVGPQALIGASIALGSQSLVEFQAGEALNDITGVAFLLCAVAILVNGYAAATAGEQGAPVSGPEKLLSRRRRMRRRRGEGFAGTDAGGPAPIAGRDIGAGALAIAGLAAGLAAGTKLSFLAPVAALTVGVVVIATRGERLRTGLVWGIPMLAAGGYWYVRNLVAVGNPIPYIASIGPISLPAPARDFHLRPDYAVVHYWNDTDVWSNWFFPGLHHSFGTLWPVALAAMAAAAVFAIWRGREPILRTLGALVIVTAVAYVFTPLTAAGEQGQPISFEWNVRYLAPAVAVALAIAPCLPALRATPGRRAAVLGGLAVVLAFTVGSLVQWQQGHTKGAVGAAVLVLAVAAAIWFAHSRGALWRTARLRMRVAIATVVLALACAAGYGEQRHYLTHRYENSFGFQDLAGALRWARDVRDARIAVAGIRGVFTQYPFYGTDLSNRVQWLGLRGPHDSYSRIPDCREWRQAVDAGDYGYAVTTFDPYLPGERHNTPEGRWTGSDPNAEAIVHGGPVRVFELRGALDPGGCAGQKPLTEAQLHSVPNLNGTSAGTG